MKTNLFFQWSILVMLGMCYSISASAQVVTCYDESQATVNDFWFSNIYYAKCTPYTATGGKDIADAAWAAYVDFNGDGYIDFTKIRVSVDGEYKLQILHGVGWANTDGTSAFTVFVNDESVGDINFQPSPGQTPENPQIKELTVTLATDYDNQIKVKQLRDWPTIMGIKLIRKGTVGISPNNHSNSDYIITYTESTLRISGLSRKSNKIQIYNLDGKLIASEKNDSDVYTRILDTKGVFIIKINDTFITKLVI